MPVTEDYNLEWNQIDEDNVRNLLINEYEFSPERVNNKLDKLKKLQGQLQQKGLSSFF